MLENEQKYIHCFHCQAMKNQLFFKLTKLLLTAMHKEWERFGSLNGCVANWVGIFTEAHTLFPQK